MPANRFFIIREDGSRSIVTREQLNQMKEQDQLNTNEQVIPIEEEQFSDAALFEEEAFHFQPAVDDLDTAPAVLERGIFKIDWSSLDLDVLIANSESDRLYQVGAQEVAEKEQALTQSLEHLVEWELNKGGLSVRLSDGRVLGPFSKEQIIEKVQKGFFQYEDQTFLGHEGFFIPFTKVPFLVAQFHIEAALKEGQQTALQVVGRFGVMPMLLKCAQQMVTGWFLVKDGLSVWCLSIVMGQVHGMHTSEGVDENNKWPLLFQRVCGETWFEPDPNAARDENTVRSSILELCRLYTCPEQGFTLQRLQEGVGQEDRYLIAKDSLTNDFKRQFSAIELEWLRLANGEHRIQEGIQKLQSDHSATALLQGLLILLAAGLVTTQAHPLVNEKKKWIQNFLSEDPWKIIIFDADTTDEEMQQKLLKLRTQVRDVLQSQGPTDHPLHSQVYEQLHRVEQVLSQPLERAIYLRAKANGLDWPIEPMIHQQLEIQSLEEWIQKWIMLNEPIRILALSEKLVRLTDGSAFALGYQWLGKHALARSPSERAKCVKQLEKLAKQHPKEPTVQLAYAQLLLQEGAYDKAKTLLHLLGEWVPKHPWRQLLDLQLQEMLASLPKTHTSHLVWSFLLTCALSVVLWLLAVDAGLGTKQTSATDYLFMATRASILVAATWLGDFILFRRSPFAFLKSLDWSAQIPWALCCLIVGSAFGWIHMGESPIHIQLKTLPVGFLIIGVCAERLFFSGFLGTQVQTYFYRPWHILMALLIMYGIYLLSFFPLFETAGDQFFERAVWILVGLIIPLSFLQVWKRSIVYPILYQIAFVVVAHGMMPSQLQRWFVSLW